MILFASISIQIIVSAGTMALTCKNSVVVLNSIIPVYLPGGTLFHFSDITPHMV